MEKTAIELTKNPFGVEHANVLWILVIGGEVDVLSSSTYKTFPGPQHGIIACKEEFADEIDRAVFLRSVGQPSSPQCCRARDRVARNEGIAKTFAEGLREVAKDLD